jgi:hypothetical protein
MRKRGGVGPAMDAVEQLARRGLFRERDLTRLELSHNWLYDLFISDLVTRHGHGVWSARNYKPTHYELLQIRFPHAVFWGPSALWLLEPETPEPDGLWLALPNKARWPRNLAPSTVIVRTRRLEDDIVTLTPPGRLLTLRVHGPARAAADSARLSAD